MSRIFRMDLDEFSSLSLKANKIIPVTAQCSVFAESEVISLLAARIRPKRSPPVSRQRSLNAASRYSNASECVPGDCDRRLCQKQGADQSADQNHRHGSNPSARGPADNRCAGRRGFCPQESGRIIFEPGTNMRERGDDRNLV